MAVVGGKLGFNTFMFSILCIVAFSIIAFNKCAIGPSAAVGLPRACTSARVRVRSLCARFVSCDSKARIPLDVGPGSSCEQPSDQRDLCCVHQGPVGNKIQAGIYFSLW